MNVNFNLKDFLAFFKKTSFRISFLIGMIVYKFYLLETENSIFKNIIDIILVVAIIFVLDDILEKIFNPIKFSKELKKCIEDLKKLTEPQIFILLYHYFDFTNEKIIVNQTSNFNLHEGEYQILASKFIIFRAASTSSSFNFPFSIQDWAYKEIIRAINAKEIEVKKKKYEYIVKWYSYEYRFNKNELEDASQTLSDMSWL